MGKAEQTDRNQKRKPLCQQVTMKSALRARLIVMATSEILPIYGKNILSRNTATGLFTLKKTTKVGNILNLTASRHG